MSMATALPSNRRRGPRMSLWASMALVLVVGWGGPLRAQGRSGDPANGGVLAVYKPVATDFRPGYLSDATNGQVQTWDQYWGWVNSYYQGNIVSNGWIKETETSLARVADAATRQELLKEMNEAGRLVSREWAKDSGVRKINTSDLISWGNRLSTARRDEKGSGADLLATARLIHGEARRKISGKPAPK